MVIDTALGLCTAGVFEASGDGEPRVLGLRSEAMTKGHQERLGGLARDAAAEAGGFEGLDRIGVTVGPGSFTGLRVGLAFAQGLGAALDRPVAAISTLDALAADAGEARAVAALIDARRGQVYARLWRDGAPTGPAEAMTLEAARSAVTGWGGEVVLIGSGAVLIAEAAPGARVLPVEGPSPTSLARLTVRADPGSGPPRPLYLRAPDATPPTRLPGQARSGARA